jgi:hypothetical protein
VGGHIINRRPGISGSAGRNEASDAAANRWSHDLWAASLNNFLLWVLLIF